MAISPDNLSPESARDQFARLYTAHHHDLYRYILTLVPHVHDAQEVLQDTSVALWRKVDDYDTAESFLPWARRFAHNEVLNHRRKFARTRGRLSDAVVEQLSIEQQAMQPTLDGRREALQDCMRRLNDDDRQLIEQRYLREDTIQQFAAERGQPADTLYKRLKRIRERLLRCINSKLEADGGAP